MIDMIREAIKNRLVEMGAATNFFMIGSYLSMK